VSKLDSKQIFWNAQYKIWKKGNLEAKDIFDIHYIARQRSYKVGEFFAGNSMYSMGYSLREYSGYFKQLYVATEHFVNAGKLDSTHEYKDNPCKILLVPSDNRRETLQKYTDKLIIPFGPGMFPYTKCIYSDFAIPDIKSYLGKTLLIFPRHSNYDSIVIDNRKRFVDFVNDIARTYNYDTVVCSLYYVDIARGAYMDYEKYGWKTWTAGHSANYDFGNCLRTMITLADHIVVQGYGSPSNYALYLNKPVTFYPASRSVKIEGRGIDEDHNNYVKEFEDKMYDLFGQYTEEVTEEQKEYVSTLFGYNRVRSPREMNAILSLAAKIVNDKTVNINHIKKIISKTEYDCIRRIIQEAIDVRKDYGY